MQGGGCRGGIPGLGPCMIAGLGRVITGDVGCPSWLAVMTSREAHFFPLGSSVDISGDFILPAANFIGSNSVGMKATPAGGMDVGDSIIGLGKTGELPMSSVC